MANEKRKKKRQNYLKRLKFSLQMTRNETILTYSSCAKNKRRGQKEKALDVKKNELNLKSQMVFVFSWNLQMIAHYWAESISFSAKQKSTLRWMLFA